MYDGVWYLAKVLDRNKHDFKFNVPYFRRQVNKRNMDSRHQRMTTLPLANVLKLVKSLKPTIRRSRTFKIDEQEREEIETIYNNMMANDEGEIY